MNTQPATLHSAVHRLQDTAFLGAYTLALRQNAALLRGKSVLVLGDGCGFLSVVCAQAGAATVYALEASELCDLVPKLAACNGVRPGVIIPVRAAVGSAAAARVVPEKQVDVVLLMPLSLLCLHEAMLHDLVTARDRFLKPEGGLVVPRQLSLFMCPLTDGATYAYLKTQAEFWDDGQFFGIDLSCQTKAAMLEHFAQPMAGQIDGDALMSQTPVVSPLDLRSVTTQQLDDMSVEFEFPISERGVVHGFGLWFELALGLALSGGGESVIRSGPEMADAQWYTCRMILPYKRLTVTPSSRITGELRMTTNKVNSYDFGIRAVVEGKDDETLIEHSFSLNNHSCSAMGTLGDEADWGVGAVGSGGAGAGVATWYIASPNNESEGPYDEGQIKKLVEGGSTTPSTFVWRDGMPDWAAIGEVDVFKACFGKGGPPALGKNAGEKKAH